MENCTRCAATKLKKNGKTRHGKQRHKCLSCNYQFSENRTKKMITKQEWKLVDKLLLEKIPIAGISRVTEISEAWIQKYVNEKFDKIPKKNLCKSRGNTWEADNRM